MKRFLFGSGVALVLALLSGFTLLSLAVQTQRVRWDGMQTGTVIAGTLGPKFGGSSDVTGAVLLGPASWRLGGIACQKTGWCFLSDAGVGHLYIDVSHEDGGLDCECDLATICASAVSTGGCICPNGVTELGGVTWTMALNPVSTVLAANPDGGASTTIASLFCAPDLFR